MVSRSPQQALGVFFSYSHHDQQTVKLLVDTLNQRLGHCVEVFVDFRNTIEGVNLTRDIFENGIARSQVVLVIWSKDAVESRWVRFEILLATMLGKLLIPVVMDEEARESLGLGFTNLGSIKYFGAYKAKGSDAIADALANLIEEWFRMFSIYHFFRKYITSYSLGPVEDEFYELAQKVLDSDNRYIVFKAGTPALLLRDEAFTPSREQYVEKLVRTYSDLRSSSRGIYLFDYRSTYRKLTGMRGDDLKPFAQQVMGNIDSVRLKVEGIRPREFAAYLPSGIWGENKGCLILREPVTGAFVGLVFLKGKELDAVRGFYLNMVSRANVLGYETWARNVFGSD